MDQRVAEQLRAFILENYLFGDGSRMPEDTDSLLGGGVLDSTGVLELIEYLEAQFDIRVEESETLPENLDSVAGLTRFIAAKRYRDEGSA